MNKLLFALIAIVFGLTSVTSATADVTIYSNDFEGETVGDTPASPFGKNAQPTGIFTVNAADANFTTQYAELGSRLDNGNFFFPFFNGNLLAADPGFAPVITYKFDAIFPTAEFTGITARLRLRARNIDSGGTLVDQTRADLLNTEVASDTINTYRYVINNTAAAADRPDMAGQIAANTYEIYEGATMIESGGSQGTAIDDLPINYMTLWLQGQQADAANGIPLVQSFVRIDNFSVIVNDSVSVVICGDINLDGDVTFLDIAPFIAILSAGGSQAEADCDMNGLVDFLDINPFIAALAAP